MQNRVPAFLIAAAGLVVASSLATAGSIRVSDIGGGIVLNSGPLSATVFGNGPSAWTAASLASAHASINASGISTNGKVTFIAADTDHGLAMMALVDQELSEQPPVAQGNLHIDTVAGSFNPAYVNSLNPINVAGSSGSQIAQGNFSWNSNGGGDAFAWSQLIPGDTMTWRFNTLAGQPLGLDASATFQFVTWTGTTWQLISLPANQVSFTASGDFGFSANVVLSSIPLPGVAGLAGLPLLALPFSRRRARA